MVLSAVAIVAQLAEQLLPTPEDRVRILPSEFFVKTIFILTLWIRRKDKKRVREWSISYTNFLRELSLLI